MNNKEITELKTKVVIDYKRTMNAINNFAYYPMVQHISNQGSVYCCDSTLKRNLKFIEELESEEFIENVELECYYMSYSKNSVCLNYLVSFKGTLEEEKFEFYLYCTDIEKTVEFLGCKIELKSNTKEEKIIVCSSTKNHELSKLK